MDAGEQGNKGINFHRICLMYFEFRCAAYATGNAPSQEGAKGTQSSLEGAHHHVGRAAFRELVMLIDGPCGCVTADVVGTNRSHPSQNCPRVLSFESDGHALGEF